MARALRRRGSRGARILGRLERSTVLKYAKVLQSLVLYTLRWVANPSLEPTVNIPRTLIEWAGRLDLSVKSTDPSAFGAHLPIFLFYLLSASTQEGVEDTWKLPIMRWFMLFCRRTSGVWLKAKEATSPLAGFQWCIRCVFFLHLRTLQGSDVDGDQLNR